MDADKTQAVAELLGALSDGDSSAAERLFPLVYDDLRNIAHAFFRNERKAHTLEPTALVHEAFVKLVGSDHTPQNEVHFRALAARAMRLILIDHARSRNAARRGGAYERVALSGIATPGVQEDIDVLALHEVLTKLADLDRQMHDIVEMRFFAGLSENEVAEALSLSRTTIQSKWRLAKVWLSKELRSVEP